MATRPASAVPASPAPAGDPFTRILLAPITTVIMYVMGPLAVYGKSRVRTGQMVAPLDDEAARALRPESRSFLDRGDDILGTLGFGTPVRGVLSQNANTASYFSLSEHQEHGVLATLAVVQTAGSALVPPKSVPVIFYRTDFTNDVAIVTTNGTTKRRFPKRPDLDGKRFPAVRDAKILYRIHRFRVAERERRVPIRKVPRGDLLQYQQRDSEENWKRWVAMGYYRPARGGVLTPTLRGAALLTWRGMFPWAQLVDWRDSRDADAVLQRWKAAGSP